MESTPPVATGADPHQNTGVHAMSGLIFLAVFIALIGGAAALGLLVDSRDSADWAPTDDGRRACR